MGSQTAIRCSVLRGGTSKGLYFHADDLPADRASRDAVLLAAMGSPDPREIDGMGGAHPLTSKVAVVRRSSRPDADVDYLFLQVWPDRPEVSDTQNCGNILAGVGPFAIEEGLVAAEEGTTRVRIWMENTQSLAVATIETPGGVVRYDGDARIDGVQGTHAPIPLEFLDIAGSSCGALLPTGRTVDEIDGVRVTCVDNGMPVVVLAAPELGVSGYETPAELEANEALRAKVEAIRLKAGPLMCLGDVTRATVPKMSTVARARRSVVLAGHMFSPTGGQEAGGVVGPVAVPPAARRPGGVAAEGPGMGPPPLEGSLDVEHPTGFFTVALELAEEAGGIVVRRAELLRTARLLMRGDVFVPSGRLPA